MHFPNKKISFIFSLATAISVATVAAGIVTHHHNLSQRNRLAQKVVDDPEEPSLMENLVTHNAWGF